MGICFHKISSGRFIEQVDKNIMKTLKNFFTLLNLNLLLVALATSDRTYQLRSNRNLSASQKSNSCKLYWKYGATEKGETESLDCEIMSEGKLFRLPLLGLSDEWLRLHKDEIVSGESILVTWKLDIDDDLVGLTVNSSTKSSKQNTRRKQKRIMTVDYFLAPKGERGLSLFIFKQRIVHPNSVRTIFVTMCLVLMEVVIVFVHN